MNIVAIFLPLVVVLFSGCTAGLSDPELDFTPPKYVEQSPAKEDQNDYTLVGSIFGQGENPLFSDHKAMHVDDVVTVVIQEVAKSSQSGSKSLSGSENTNLGGGLATYGGSNSLINQATKQLNNLGNIGFSTASESAFKGQGSSTTDASFTTTVTARIIKVLENGNYYIYGKREILVDNQKQIMQIGGVIRPYDIDQNNRILSSQVSDAKILYRTQGDVDQASQRGWGAKIINAVWPF